LHPLALKESQHRWYLLATEANNEQIKTFALDRIADVEITKASFKSNKPSIEEEFKNYFGIMTLPARKPEKVVLSLTYLQGQYLKTFPLHTSQIIKSESKEEDEIIFELFISVTDDFVMELLSLGSDVEVKSPAGLRKIIKRNLTQTLKYY
jgi:predicted DNA-binding transcriptional regulator YafY